MKREKFLLWLVISFSLLCWEEITFSQTNFWEQTNGPLGGSINAFDINSEEHLFATARGGVFHSTDNGENWRAINAS